MLTEKINIRLDSKVFLKIKDITDNYSDYIRLSIDEKLSKDEKRNEVIKKNGMKCFYCDKILGENDLMHIDHIVPIKKGGTSHLFNLVVSCPECNLKKSDFSLSKNFNIDNIVNTMLFDTDIEIYNKKYISEKDLTKIYCNIIRKIKSDYVRPYDLESYLRTEEASSFLAQIYKNNIKPVMNNEENIYIYYLIVFEFLIYSIGKNRHLVYKELFENMNILNFDKPL